MTAIGVLARPGESRRILAVSRALSHSVEIRAGADTDGVVGLMASSREAAGAAIDDPRLAVWNDGRIEMGPESWVAPGHDRAVDVSRWPFTPPLVRSRWRERLGLDSRMVVDVASLDAEDVPTALAVASAVVIDEFSAPLAMALGTPSVGSAEVLAAFPGSGLVRGGLAEADALAADSTEASKRSRQLRHYAAAELSPFPAVYGLLRAWGIHPPLEFPLARAEELSAYLSPHLRSRLRDSILEGAT